MSLLPSIAFRRPAFAAILVFFSISASCFAQPVFLSVRSTPYDHQMIRVSAALTARSTPRPVSLPVVQWMTELRAMPYRYSTFWQTPAEVDLEQVSDCKGKAIELYEKMRKNGATNLRFVIGKHHIYDSATHAWLEWETTAGVFVLDPTWCETPLRAAEIDPLTYMPLYAYDGVQKYCVANISLLKAPARVATGVSYQNRVAAFRSVRPAAAGLVPVSLSASSFMPFPMLEPNAGTSWPGASASTLRSTSLAQPRRVSLPTGPVNRAVRPYDPPTPAAKPACDHCGFRRLNR